jgi:hypothetical protein
MNADGTKTAVYRSRYVTQDLNPQWPIARIRTSLLNMADPKQPLFIEVWDYDSPKKSDFIGSATILVENLIQTGFTVALINAKKSTKKKNYTDSGHLKVVQCSVGPLLCMTHWTRGGRLSFELTVAVDFTSSNGSPSSSSSLHEKKSGNNQYQQVMRSVGKVLLPYDADGKIAAYGFGGSRNLSTSHCFPLKKDQPEVIGLEGLMEAYDEALQRMSLSAPTLANEVISAVANSADALYKRSAADGIITYSILLLITDGELNDMYATVGQIVRASYLPLSIIIVGVGSAQFDGMEGLDADLRLLKFGKQLAQRDIVQFVPYLKYRDDAHRLAAEVLRELPGQVLEFMQLNNIAPSL